jgi:uncharacterized protein GlcG (DUF336 family)
LSNLVVSTSTIPLAAAERAIAAGQQKAAEIGIRCTITVIDSGGNLVAAARMDGAVLASIETSYTKARTSLLFASPTADLTAEVQPGQPMFSIGSAMSEPLAFLAGGVPIVDTGKLIGAVGVGGGASHQDHDVATTAIAAI